MLSKTANWERTDIPNSKCIFSLQKIAVRLTKNPYRCLLCYLIMKMIRTVLQFWYNSFYKLNYTLVHSAFLTSVMEIKLSLVLNSAIQVPTRLKSGRNSKQWVLQQPGWAKRAEPFLWASLWKRQNPSPSVWSLNFCRNLDPCRY